jgi:membrane protein
VTGEAESPPTGAGVPSPREAPEDSTPAGGPRFPARLHDASRAVQQRYSGSAVEHLWKRLQLVDFINRGTLFAAVLLLCFVPFMITLQALEGRSATTTVIRRFGLDRQAAADVGHVFASPASASHAITGLSWVFFVLGGIGAAAALQELYEHAFGLPNRGWRDTHRQVAWLAAVVATGVLANRSGPWLHDHGRPVLYPLAALVSATLFWWFTMWLLLGGRRGWRRLFPSALATGVCSLGITIYFRFTMSGAITSGYAKYGPIGVVFVIMSVLVAVGVGVILGALAGAVWDERHAARFAAADRSADPAPELPPVHGDGVDDDHVQADHGQ